MTGLIIFGSLLIGMFMGLPVCFALLAACLIYLIPSGIPLTIVPQTMIAGMNSFVLLAIPLFTMTGYLMEQTSLSRRLVDFVEALFCRSRGSMGVVTIVTCAIGRQYKAHAPMPMDAERMHEEAQSLCGRHDFAAFAASGSVAKSTVRTIYRAQVERQGEDVVLTVLGDGFLYNMVRIIAGTLMEVGTGKREPGCIARAIETGDRLLLGQTAPACGLTLMRVLYDGDEEKALGYFA